MTGPWTSIRRVLREPLLHFAILGAGVFWLGTLANDPDEPDRTLVVSRDVQERIVADLEAKLGRPPSEAERTQAIDGWVDGELLYREGLALGLDRDDPMVRQRVIQKMEFVSTNLEVPQEPDDATLRAFMARAPERWAGPPRYDFMVLTLPRLPEETDDARAQQALESLRAGADPKSVGGRHASGKGFSAANLMGTYGPEIGAAVAELPPGEWAMLPNPGGWTLVHVEAVQPGEGLPFEKIRNRVLLDFKASRRGTALRERLDELRTRYAVSLEP
ncbi:peptidylprolyl isomerase [Paraliomyxa miuraensis]|uniref:peptidylprolyl isomerase n=1 Tax=Paraliomyxa miuraensis TaxID=376150 RepID=UPI0022512FD3|nr:peptidylprolyl isomerase [Paraliomyxa miuraensis]MCX4244990.1 peptidylprolyl isomerase [Paraliomyxa miuraensis]